MNRGRFRPKNGILASGDPSTKSEKLGRDKKGKGPQKQVEPKKRERKRRNENHVPARRPRAPGDQGRKSSTRKGGNRKQSPSWSRKDNSPVCQKEQFWVNATTIIQTKNDKVPGQKTCRGLKKNGARVFSYPGTATRKKKWLPHRIEGHPTEPKWGMRFTIDQGRDGGKKEAKEKKKGKTR